MRAAQTSTPRFTSGAPTLLLSAVNYWHASGQPARLRESRNSSNWELKLREFCEEWKSQSPQIPPKLPKIDPLCIIRALSCTGCFQVQIHTGFIRERRLADTWSVSTKTRFTRWPQIPRSPFGSRLWCVGASHISITQPVWRKSDVWLRDQTEGANLLPAVNPTPGSASAVKHEGTFSRNSAEIQERMKSI